MYNSYMGHKHLTIEQLLGTAHTKGYSWLSTRQIERWRKFGLLPRSRRKHLGKGKGTESTYPEGTDKQLLALCALRPKRQRLITLAWQLWLDGYPISMKMIRSGLKEIAEVLRGVRAAAQNDPEIGQTLLAEKDISRTKFYDTLRKRLRSGKKAECVIKFVLSIVYDVQRMDLLRLNESGKILEHMQRALDLEEGVTGTPSTNRVWYRGDIGKDLQEISKRLPEIIAVVASATDEEIEKAGHDLRVFRRLPGLLEKLQRATGTPIQGQATISTARFDQPLIGSLVLAMLIYFSRTNPTGINQVITAIQAVDN